MGDHNRKSHYIAKLVKSCKEYKDIMTAIMMSLFLIQQTYHIYMIT